MQSTSTASNLLGGYLENSSFAEVKSSCEVYPLRFVSRISPVTAGLFFYQFLVSTPFAVAKKLVSGVKPTPSLKVITPTGNQAYFPDFAPERTCKPSGFSAISISPFDSGCFAIIFRTFSAMSSMPFSFIISRKNFMLSVIPFHSFPLIKVIRPLLFNEVKSSIGLSPYHLHCSHNHSLKNNYLTSKEVNLNGFILFSEGTTRSNPFLHFKFFTSFRYNSEHRLVPNNTIGDFLKEFCQGMDTSSLAFPPFFQFQQVFKLLLK